jgi:hypothetical protein
LKKCFYYIFLICVLHGCHALQVVDETNFYGRYMNYYTNSVIVQKHLVFTHMPCDSLELKDTGGKKLKLWKRGMDGNCYTCSDLESEKPKGFFSNFNYRNESFEVMTVFPSGNLSVSSYACSKFVEGWLKKWGDSLSVVLWHTVDTVKGQLTVYLAEEAYSYPFYKTGKLDSLVYDLNKFCSDKEKEEIKQWMKEFFQKNIIVEVTPNPFTANFVLNVKYNGNFYKPEGVMSLEIIDENGKQLLSQKVELDRNYTFEFPDVLPGKYIYYRFTWDECIVSGQILKANN